MHRRRDVGVVVLLAIMVGMLTSATRSWGQALADEAALGDRQSSEGAGFAHEPRGASRDEEHGDAPLQRAETEGIDDEVTAALENEDEPEEYLTEPPSNPANAKTSPRR